VTSKIYESIKARTPEDIHLNIKSILTYAIGEENTMTKEDIAHALYKTPCSHRTDEHGNQYPVYLNSSRDRQIRDAVAELVIYFDQHIVTDTDNGGFHYAGSTEEIDANIADLQSRCDAIQLRIAGLNRARVKVFNKSRPGGAQPGLFTLHPQPGQERML